MTPLNTSSYSQWTPLKFFSEEQEGQDEEEEQEEERNKRNQNQNRTSEFGLSAGRSLISLPHRPLLLLPLLLASGLCHSSFYQNQTVFCPSFCPGCASFNTPWSVK